MPSPSPARRGIQSIEVGGQLLRALAHEGRPLALKDLAHSAGMSPAKAHPYLVSFGKLGLIEQIESSGRYALGPLAMQMGLISLQQLDPVALAMPVIERLAAQCGHTVAMVVWGNHGATVVRIAQPPSAVHVSMRHGTVMSLRNTASGRLFAAWLPPEQVLPVLRAEARALNLGARAARIDAAWAAELAEVRRLGLAQVSDVLLQGISAMAVPVFDARGHLVLGLTAIGLGATFAGGAQGAMARSLLDAAAGLSTRLGAAAAA